MDELHGIRDHSLIEDYFDAIDQLLAIVRAEEQLPPEFVKGRAMELCQEIAGLQEVCWCLCVCVSAVCLCQPVSQSPKGVTTALPRPPRLSTASNRKQPNPTPQRIDSEVGPREMTVRQMLHHTALRSRQASLSVPLGEITEVPGGGQPPGGYGYGRRRFSAEYAAGAGGRHIIDMRRAAVFGGGRAATAPPPQSALHSVQSVDTAVVDPLDDVAQVQAVAALARALSTRSTGSGGPGSVGGASPRSVGGAGRFSDASRTAGLGGEVGVGSPRSGSLPGAQQ
jgi:hypothetical protein